MTATNTRTRVKTGSKRTAGKSASKTTVKAGKLKFSRETYVKWHRDMLLMRRFEERCGHLYIQQKFGGFCHLYIGQEAVLAGMSAGMLPSDRVITAYRDHAHPLVLGTDPKYVMAELYGKRTGTSKGKGGSMHMFDRERNLFGGHGIVGGQIGLAAGIAFADKYREEDHVTVCFFGDGAARQGILHEAFNMAMNWKLPVIYVVENNQYAMGTSVERTSNVTDLKILGRSYDMPSANVDGMSPEAVADAMAQAASHCRSGKGPFLLDIQTYRYKGHSMSDPQTYRTKQEVEAFVERDPIQAVKQVILKQKWMNEADLEAVDQAVRTQVEEAIQFAEDSPKPDASELYEDVYVTPNYPFVKD
jgi:pyruvate dehydrogenase E1 component alpha subunit